MDNLTLPDIDEITKTLCKKSFYYFVREFWNEIIPEEPIWNWHIEYLCNELQKAVERVIAKEPKIEDIAINIPPGMSKSTICTIMLPVWAWIKDSTLRAMTASYSGALSQDHSTKSRDIIKSEKFQRLFPELKIRKDIDNKGRYMNTNNGERFATSVGGSVTGFHAHLIIVDDPLNPKEAVSEKERDTANRFMNETLSTRKIDKSVTLTILVMQRLHQNDPTGNWLKKQKPLKHICLPGEASSRVKPENLLSKYKDGLLDPIRLSKENLTNLKTDLGSYGYAGQIAQEPAPEDGGIWKRTILPISREELNKLKLQRLATDWDLAYTKNERNSASAYITAGVHDRKMYITDLDYKHLEFPELIKLMETLQAPHYIENKASGVSAKQTLTKSGIPAIEVNVKGGDKIARTTMATPYAEAGLVYCAEDLLEKLYNDASQGILMFPNNEGDDLNDALVQAIYRLLKNNTVGVTSSRRLR